MSDNRSVYRVVMSPIVVSATEPARALRAARLIAQALQSAKRELGLRDESPAAVEVLGPNGGWRKVREPPSRRRRH